MPPPGPMCRCTALKTMPNGFPWLPLARGSAPSFPVGPPAPGRHAPGQAQLRRVPGGGGPWTASQL
eukprot:11178591-Lingulodinium_polyedra.AAC.1